MDAKLAVLLHEAGSDLFTQRWSLAQRDLPTGGRPGRRFTLLSQLLFFVGVRLELHLAIVELLRGLGALSLYHGLILLSNVVLVLLYDDGVKPGQGRLSFRFLGLWRQLFLLLDNFLCCFNCLSLFYLFLLFGFFHLLLLEQIIWHLLFILLSFLLFFLVDCFVASVEHV